MKNKIAYFMAKDTRLIVDNLTKVIIDEDMLVIKYTLFRKDFDDETITALRYYKSKKTMIIYNELKEYNENVYNSFIKWAKEKGINWYSLGKVIIDEKEEI